MTNGSKSQKEKHFLMCLDHYNGPNDILLKQLFCRIIYMFDSIYQG